MDTMFYCVRELRGESLCRAFGRGSGLFPFILWILFSGGWLNFPPLCLMIRESLLAGMAQKRWKNRRSGA